MVEAAWGGESLASVGAGVGGRGSTLSGGYEEDDEEEGVEAELQLEEGTGMGAVVLDMEVEMEEVVRCKAEDRAAEREATEPITEESEVVGGVEEYPGRL